MARQTFQAGQKVAIRHQGSYGHWTKVWYAAVVENVTADNKRVHVYAAVPNLYGRGLVYARPSLDNNRSYIDGSLDRISGLDFDWLETLRREAIDKERSRKAGFAKREHDDAENLERGWTRLLAELGTSGAGARVVLTPLIDTHALRSYGAEAAVSA